MVLWPSRPEIRTIVDTGRPHAKLKESVSCERPRTAKSQQSVRPYFPLGDGYELVSLPLLASELVGCRQCPILSGPVIGVAAIATPVEPSAGLTTFGKVQSTGIGHHSIYGSKEASYVGGKGTTFCIQPY